MAGMDTTGRAPLLFHRDFRRLTGGHLKVWHYYRHAGGSRRYQPQVYLTPHSLRGPENPFDGGDQIPLAEWRPESAATLFVAGLDWLAVPADYPGRIVNLVQGVRHGMREDPRREFLRRRAVRICVSREVSDAIGATALVNGPAFTIPNGLDPIGMPAVRPWPRPVPLLIVGWKDAVLAADVADRLRAQGASPHLLCERLPREEFLGRLAASEVVVFLPLAAEGCFLPALEAFGLGCLVVCPDCVGNRSFCRDGDTCLHPPREPGPIAAAALAALAFPVPRRERMVAAATREAAGLGLEGERRAFLEILDNLDAIW